MDNLSSFTFSLLFIAFCMFLFGVATYFFYEIYKLHRLNKLIDAEFEKYNDFMPTHWTDDWNGGDDIDEPLLPICDCVPGHICNVHKSA